MAAGEGPLAYVQLTHSECGVRVVPISVVYPHLVERALQRHGEWISGIAHALPRILRRRLHVRTIGVDIVYFRYPWNRCWQAALRS